MSPTGAAGHTHAAIMAGGPGKRFWPVSTERRPKPFLKLVGEETLIQACYRRLRAFIPPERILVICAAGHLDLVAEQLPDLPPETRVGESEGRDSAACIALATAIVLERDAAASLVAAPADQVIEPADAFANAILAVVEATAEHGCLGTVGVEPFEPATRFGYIEVGPDLGVYRGLAVTRVARFTEKPKAEIAASYLRSGRHLWNAGIFVAPACVMEAEIKARCEPLGRGLGECRRLLRAGTPPGEVTRAVYGSVPRISIDYAVVEKVERVVTVRAPFAWDDVGDWRALRRHLPRDEHGNVSVGDHVGDRTRSSIVVAGGLTVATLGLEDVVVVRDGDRLLVARADLLDELKGLVDTVERRRGAR